MTLQQLRDIAAARGYRIEVEEKSYLDRTPVYAIYKGFARIIRFGTIAAAAQWF